MVRSARRGRQPDVFGTDVGVAEQGRLVRVLVQQLLNGAGRGRPPGGGQAEHRDEPARIGPGSLVQELAEPACWPAGYAFMIARPDRVCHVRALASRPAPDAR